MKRIDDPEPIDIDEARAMLEVLGRHLTELKALRLRDKFTRTHRENLTTGIKRTMKWIQGHIEWSLQPRPPNSLIKLFLQKS